jgi:hypothetical protein
MSVRIPRLAYLTGKIARESGAAFLAARHRATERLGLPAAGAGLARIPAWRAFVDVAQPGLSRLPPEVCFLRSIKVLHAKTFNP